jgi:hypothetical protein
MMKNQVILFAIFLNFILLQNTFAQRKPGNEWINYTQTYYKFKVVQNGIYRLGYADLQNAGMPVSSINPNNLQLFYRGVEVPIYVSSGSKSNFGASDYIEFYGQGNDGALDSVLYLNPADDINKSYSMYTDTSAYFLTIGSTASTARYITSLKTYGNTPVSNFQGEAAVNIHQAYQYGAPIYPEYNFYGSDYNAGQGWMSFLITTLNISTPNSRSYLINVPDVPQDTVNLPKPSLEILVYSKSDVSSQNPDHHLVILLGSKVVWDTTFDGFKTIHKTINRYWSDIYSGSANYVVKAAGVALSGTSTSDVICVSFLKVKYTSSFSINSSNPALKFSLKNSSGNQTDFNFTSPTAPASPKYLVLYDLTHGVRTGAFTMTGQNAYLSIDNYQDNTSYYLYDTTMALKPVFGGKINFSLPDISQNYNYIIITNKLFAQGAAAFAAYKSGKKIDSVNNFKPLIAYTDDIYDQFFYGVHHPAAIQNFMRYLYNNQAEKPQYLLLLGKGINNADVRNYYRFDYVPGIGYPSADVMFTSGIPNGFQGKEKVIDPLMGIGRLQILSNNDIYNYLDKLKAYDANINIPQLDLKTAINVDGGDNNQIAQIRNFMDGQAKVLSGPYTGLKVNSYYSVSNDAVNKYLKAAIQKNIESGTSLFSYLAHGAAEQLQVEFADTNTLNNKGHYPVMYLNGCNLGNASLTPPAAGVGRFFTLKPNKGGIIWLSHSNTALDNVLYAQMAAFYKNVTKDNYGQSVGSDWRKTIVDLKNYQSLGEFRALCYEWTLQGDPSVKLPYRPDPDYAVFDSLLFFPVQEAIATSQSFKIAVPIANFGRTDSARIKIKITQTLPDHSVKGFDTLIHPVSVLDTVYFNIKRNNANIQGLNRFDVYVNYDSSIKEISYANNHASFSHYFEGNSVRTLFPNDFDIVNVDTPSLMSQSRNLLSYNTGIYFEMDTTDLFNSPLRQKSPLLKGSSLITWKPKLNNVDKSGNPIDSTVYYWRSRMNLPLDTGGQWESKSFVYLKKGYHGWSQSHWQQYKNITGDMTIIDTVARKMSFLPSFANFTMLANPFTFANMSIKEETGFWEVFGWDIGNDNIAIIEYDKNTLKPYPYNRITGKRLKGKGGANGQTVMDANYIAYDMTNAKYRDSFKKEISLVPDGNMILLVSRGIAEPHLNLWDDSSFRAVEMFGDTMMRHLHPDSVAFAIAGYKGTPKGKLIKEGAVYDPHPSPWPGDSVKLNIHVQGIANDTGRIISQVVGPASSWKTMSQVYRHLEPKNADFAFMKIDGIDSAGQSKTIYDSIASARFDISGIDAAKYPYLRLTASLHDTLAWTPPQLRLWQLEYYGIPEGTLVGDNQGIYPSGTYKQGDSVHIRIKFQNISNLPMKKMLVNINVQDKKSIVVLNQDNFYQPIQPGEFFWIDRYINTTHLDGDNFINVFVNPNRQQPELSLDNNFIQFKVTINNGNTIPVMDVTFNGVHLADGAIVSPSPEIVVSLRDDSRYLILNDTSFFNLSLLYPDSSHASPVYFSNPKVSFVKGDTSNNNAVVTYRPGPLHDGTYLFSAQAHNSSGVMTGTTPYEIHFRVISSPAISNVYFYPNPLTDVSRFVFTITGSNVPDNMQIFLFDVTGKRVKTLELKNRLRVGDNEISWDGTGDNGAPLGQGLYIYKVFVNYPGMDSKAYPRAEDNQLQQGYGKIMVIRE